MKFIIIIIAVVAISTFVFLRSKSTTTAPPPEEVMKKMASEAVSLANDYYKLDLDYSEESIPMVEDILGQLHVEYLKTKNEEGLFGLAVMYGAYIGEVVKRNHQIGYWEKDHPAIGEMTFPYFLEVDNCFFPVGWCQKRILDGDADNVVSKYKICVTEQLEKLSNQQVDPIVTTPVDEVEPQSTQGHP